MGLSRLHEVHEYNRHMKTHLMSKITPYDVAYLCKKAYAQVANISKGEAGFRARGIYSLNPNIFTDQDFLAASLIAQEVEQNYQNVQNLGATQSCGMAFFSEHFSPLAGPSNVNQCSKADFAVPGTSNHDFVDKQRETSVPFCCYSIDTHYCAIF